MIVIPFFFIIKFLPVFIKQMKISFNGFSHPFILHRWACIQSASSETFTKQHDIMKSIGNYGCIREQTMHDAFKRTRKIHNDDLYFFSFFKREPKKIVSQTACFSILYDVKCFTANGISNMKSICISISCCPEFINGADDIIVSS